MSNRTAGIMGLANRPLGVLGFESRRWAGSHASVISD